MTTNPYFNNFSANPSAESHLMEDLVIESIRMYGADIYYLPRTPLSATDPIYGENPGSVFSTAYQIEIYLEDVTKGATGGGKFFAKFGLEIKDQMKVIIARRPFQKNIPMNRPNEGDLIWIPQLNNLYEIKYVEEEKDFYSLGRRPPFFYYYELQLELFKINNERFNTGVADIDNLGMDYSYTIKLNMSSGTGAFSIGENVYQGIAQSNATASGIVKNWNATNNILSIITINGTFSDGANVTGNISGAKWAISTYNQRDFGGVLEEFVDNDNLQSEANLVIQFDTNNPFGTPGP